MPYYFHGVTMSLGRRWCAVGLVGALMTTCAVDSVVAEVRIHGDLGGQIESYLERYALIRDSGEKVVFDGPCISACTLALAVIPLNRICITQNAVFGFHAAWDPRDGSKRVRSASGTNYLMSRYPPKIRAWIKRHGGLGTKTILLRGRELAAILRRCS
jgi:hypothetical protein